MIGRRLGSFTINSLLGAGGMGEVYRARDSKLDRDVAIKVLPAVWLLDEERRARFDREARLLASLNHPHIGAIYGVEDVDDSRALVLELVDGPTLADLLAAGPLPFADAMRVASQIASALDAAHQSGIVHRDLKPANIKVRADDEVKVLDFGLAKLASDDAESTSSRAATGIRATREGAVLGTAAYMSPEQARGLPVDKRTDIWAFGCILYEMLSGRAAFSGSTWSDTIAAVLQHEPDWHALPGATPSSIQQLARRCLEKDVARRLRDIGDARSEFDDARSSRDGPERIESPARERPHRTRLLTASVVLGSIAVAAAAWTLKPVPPTAATSLARLTVPLADGDTLSPASLPGLAISPDGRTLAYTARRGNRSPQLFVRTLDGFDATALPATDGASSPFFSPDGRWVGFFAQGKLKKVLATGGGLQTLCDAALAMGGSWSVDGSIYFAPFNTSAIWNVSADGGNPHEFSHIDRQRGEVSHRWPQVLSDGKTLLFTVWTGPGWDEKHLEVQVGTGEHRMLVRGASTGRYLKSGHLVYSKAETLLVVPFDVAALKVTGNPVTIVDRAEEAEGEGANFAISEGGTLAYVPGNATVYDRQLVWVRRDGTLDRIDAPPGAYTDPALSPDGRFAAVSIQGPTQTLWIYDFARAALSTLPSIGSSQAPLWTTDGHRIIYRSTRNGSRNLFWRSADGDGDEERLTTSDTLQTPGSVSSDGTRLIFSDTSPDSGRDLWTLDLRQSTRMPDVFLRTPVMEQSPILSPTGEWVAYSSDESGRAEIYVRPFPGAGGKLAISVGGGTEPRWSKDGREMFYRSGNSMMAVSIQTSGPSPVAGAPRVLFTGHYQATDTSIAGYDVAADGRFLMVQPAARPAAGSQIRVVLGWRDDLQAHLRGDVAP